MIEKEHIDRINELAAIAKVRELTEEELAERTVLRRAYIDAIKGLELCDFFFLLVNPTKMIYYLIVKPIKYMGK